MTTDERLIRLFVQVADAMARMSEAMERMDRTIEEIRQSAVKKTNGNGKEPRVMVDTAPMPRQGGERYLKSLGQRPPLLSPSYRENDAND